MINDLTLHQINNRVVLEELIASDRLRVSLQKHLVHTMNNELSTAEKLTESMKLLTSVDHPNLKYMLTSVEKIHSLLPFNMCNKMNLTRESKVLLSDGEKLQTMFDLGITQLNQNIIYEFLPGVNELIAKIGNYFIEHIASHTEILSIMIKQFAYAEFIACFSFHPYLLPIVGSVLFFKFSIQLMISGNFIGMLKSVLIFVKTKLSLTVEATRLITITPEQTQAIIQDLKASENVTIPIVNKSTLGFQTSHGVEVSQKRSEWVKKLIAGGIGTFILGAMLPFTVTTFKSYFSKILLTPVNSAAYDLGYNSRNAITGMFCGFFRT